MSAAGGARLAARLAAAARRRSRARTAAAPPLLAPLRCSCSCCCLPAAAHTHPPAHPPPTRHPQGQDQLFRAAGGRVPAGGRDAERAWPRRRPEVRARLLPHRRLLRRLLSGGGGPAAAAPAALLHSRLCRRARRLLPASPRAELPSVVGSMSLVSRSAPVPPSPSVDRKPEALSVYASPTPAAAPTAAAGPWPPLHRLSRVDCISHPPRHPIATHTTTRFFRDTHRFKRGHRPTQTRSATLTLSHVSRLVPRATASAETHVCVARPPSRFPVCSFPPYPRLQPSNEHCRHPANDPRCPSLPFSAAACPDPHCPPLPRGPHTPSHASVATSPGWCSNRGREKVCRHRPVLSGWQAGRQEVGRQQQSRRRPAATCSRPRTPRLHLRLKQARLRAGVAVLQPPRCTAAPTRHHRPASSTD